MPHELTDPPAPAPDTVTASRNHLTSRYALGVDKLLWDLEKRPMPDADAVHAVVAMAASGERAAGRVDVLDIAAALVVAQAMRLEVDAMEADVLDAAATSGVPAEALAAILELPDAQSAQARHDMLRARRDLPRPPVPPQSQAPPSDLGAAATRAGQRAARAGARAAEAGHRREELRRAQSGAAPGPGGYSQQENAERAAAYSSEARLSARDSAERVALGLLRAAETLERCAARCQDWEEDAAAHDDLRARAAQYLKSAQSYREMADRYRDIGQQLP